jgi:hypothetical protein
MTINYKETIVNKLDTKHSNRETTFFVLWCFVPGDRTCSSGNTNSKKTVVAILAVLVATVGGMGAATGSALADPLHCDISGWPSCYRIGYQDGQANPGTSCPSGHSDNFCAGWAAGANTRSGHEPSLKGVFGTYNQGNADGRQNAKDTFNSGGQYDSKCPSGHSDIYCTGYFVGYNYEWTLLKAANS